MERIKDEKIIQEKWKDIPGYKGIYQASSLGRIRSVERYIKCNVSNQHKVNIKTKRHIKEKILKCGIDKDGYKKISLSKDGKAKHLKAIIEIIEIYLQYVMEDKKLVVDINGFMQKHLK